MIETELSASNFSQTEVPQICCLHHQGSCVERSQDGDIHMYEGRSEHEITRPVNSWLKNVHWLWWC